MNGPKLGGSPFENEKVTEAVASMARALTQFRTNIQPAVQQMTAACAELVQTRQAALPEQPSDPDTASREAPGGDDCTGTTACDAAPANDPAGANCCVCAGGPVVYHNYRHQPFCQHCADCTCTMNPCVRTGINDPAVSETAATN